MLNHPQLPQPLERDPRKIQSSLLDLVCAIQEIYRLQESHFVEAQQEKYHALIGLGSK